MNMAILLLVAAYFLTSAKWLIRLVWMGWIVGTVASMLRDEEVALVDKCEDEYRAYMRRTGHVLPLFG